MEWLLSIFLKKRPRYWSTYVKNQWNIDTKQQTTKHGVVSHLYSTFLAVIVNTTAQPAGTLFCSFNNSLGTKKKSSFEKPCVCRSAIRVVAFEELDDSMDNSRLRCKQQPQITRPNPSFWLHTLYHTARESREDNRHRLVSLQLGRDTKSKSSRCNRRFSCAIRMAFRTWHNMQSSSLINPNHIADPSFGGFKLYPQPQKQVG